MAVGSGIPYNLHTGTGVATTFGYTFTLLDAADLVVRVDGVETTAYTVSGIGLPSGGAVVFAVAPANGSQVELFRNVGLVRLTDYQNNGDLLAPTLNEDFDRLWMAVQGVSFDNDGAVRVPSPEQIGALPAAADRASRVLAFDADGDPIAIVGVDAGSAAALQLDLANSASGKGAAMVGFVADAPGAEARTVSDKLRDMVNVKDFGAIGDGIANDTDAMQWAHDTGKVVYYPPGTYSFTTVSAVSGGIIGAGQTQTVLVSADTTSAALFTFTGDSVGGPGNALTFRDFQLQGQYPAKTTGAGIRVEPATNENTYAYASNVTISYVPVGFDFVRASLFRLECCNLLAYLIAGVQVANKWNNDAGDSAIVGCMFNCPFSGGAFPAGIKQFSSGGLKVLGNKFLGGNYGYMLAYTDSDGGGTNTSNLLLVGNSIENFHTNAIALTKVSAGLTSFKNVVISGNQIAVALSSPAFLIVSDSGAWLQNVSITGNVMQLPGVTNSYGIDLIGVTGLSISGNTFRGNGGTSQAIGLTSCVDAKIGPNVYSNITTPYLLSTPGANNSAVLDSQSGTASTATTGWSAYYGSGLYISGTTTVTFAQPFQLTPSASDVSFALAAGDGSLSVIVVAVTKTQLQFAVLSSRTPGYAASVNWKVWGIL